MKDDAMSTRKEVYERKWFNNWLTGMAHSYYEKANCTGRTAKITGGLNPGTEYELQDVSKRWWRTDILTKRWVHEDRLKIVEAEVRDISGYEQ